LKEISRYISPFFCLLWIYSRSTRSNR